MHFVLSNVILKFTSLESSFFLIQSGIKSTVNKQKDMKIFSKFSNGIAKEKKKVVLFANMHAHLLEKFLDLKLEYFEIFFFNMKYIDWNKGDYNDIEI